MSIRPCLVLPEEIQSAIKRAQKEDINVGVCLTCGEEEFNCHPDKEKGECLYCGSETVMGRNKLPAENA